MIDFYKFTHLQKHPSLLHVVTQKSNDFPYTFSLALHTGEKKQSILANRNTLATLLENNEPLHYVVANQTHSDHIRVISQKETKGWQTLSNAIEDCDALITNVKSVVLTILTADCVPILLYDKQKEVVAAVHAGWKGTKAQILSKTVHKMTTQYGCNPKDIIACIAPSIGRCCYEVGEDVAKHFFHLPNSFTAVQNKYMLDLPYINKQQLLTVGVLEEQIQMSEICTACEVTHFFSYRKEKGCSGRFMSMIGLKANHIM